MKRRTTSLLFAVVTGVPVAMLAPPTEAAVLPVAKAVLPMAKVELPTAKAVQPRVLPSGVPACGNVLGKLPPDPVCHEVPATAVEIIGTVIGQAREIGSVLGVFGDLQLSSLTVAKARRPRS